mgnify:CR=1 FL=1
MKTRIPLILTFIFLFTISAAVIDGVNFFTDLTLGRFIDLFGERTTTRFLDLFFNATSN